MAETVFYNVTEAPFEVFGVYEDKEKGGFRRLPAEVAEKVSPDVLRMSDHTAGGRVRFRTDSCKVVIRAKTEGGFMYHATPLMSRGFDLYVDYSYGHRLIGATWLNPEGADVEHTLWLDGKENDVTVSFPLFGKVKELYIGLDEGATLGAHTPYTHKTPIVFYGSSITHGACASRPGKCYEAIMSRKYDFDFINLGFSGSAKAEDAMVEYMSSLRMSAFVCDYDHNAPNVEYLRDTHHKMYKKIREKNPDIPYFMISKPDFRYEKDFFDRRAVIMQSYLDAWHAGDKNVYFIDGSAFSNGLDTCEFTVDSCHPTDEGFARMAAYIGDVLSKVMKI